MITHFYNHVYTDHLSFSGSILKSAVTTMNVPTLYVFNLAPVPSIGMAFVRSSSGLHVAEPDDRSSVLTLPDPLAALDIGLSPVLKFSSLGFQDVPSTSECYCSCFFPILFYF